MSQQKGYPKFLFFVFCMFSAECLATPINIGEVAYSSRLINVGAGQPTISAGDINTDGNLDIIVTNQSDNSVMVFLGNGKGALQPSGTFSAGDNPSGVDVADINNDGHLDLAIANHETSHISLLLGKGDGSFSAASHSPLKINVNPHPHVVRLVDLDGDNNVDLIIDSRSNNGLLVLKGLGNGDFNNPGVIVNGGGDPYRGFAIGDINRDGHLDLVTPNQRDIGILLNSGDSALSFKLNKLPQPESPFAVELADLDGDGNLDLITTSNGTLATVFPGDGRGNFLENNKTEFKVSRGAKQIATGDINGDGIEDALISSWSGESVAIIGDKSTLALTAIKHAKIANPWGIAILDLNKDGKSDFVIGDGKRSLAAVYLSHSNP